jgi:3-oxoacyl-[acyl-carrier protein] reductase
MMDFQLNDKVALVLGGGGGLGSAIACSLAREGAKVAVADLDLKAAEATVRSIVDFGGVAHPIAWDLADAAAGRDRISEITSKLGPVDVLVNNTGGPPPGSATGTDAKLWLKHFEAMVLSVIQIADLVLPGMRARGWGRIITSTSSGVIAPIPNLAISNALRSSLVGWSKSLANEVARDGVTANIVLPGRIATSRISFLDQAKATREQRDLKSVVDESVSSIPMGRYGRPEEYGNVVAFLASGAASYITGSIIRIDGGYIQSI